MIDPGSTDQNPHTTSRRSQSTAVMSPITRSKAKDLRPTAEGEVSGTGSEILGAYSICTKLPTELLIEVLSHVDMKTLLLAQRVNSEFRAVIQSSPILRRHLWLEPNQQILHSAPKCTWHTTSQCPPRCNLMQPAQVIVNPLIMHVLDMGNSKHILPMERVSKDQRRKYTQDELDKCELAKGEINKRHELLHRPKSFEYFESMHDLPHTRPARSGSQDPNGRKLRENAYWQAKTSSALTLAELRLEMSTVKHCLAVVNDKVEHSWKNMILFQGASVVEFTMSYNVVEYSHKFMEGRFPREHLISAGKFGGKITVSELIAVLKERHRDIHMLE